MTTKQITIVVALAAITIAVVIASQPARQPAAVHRNILFISIDSLRADHLGISGYPRDTTPFIDGLAARAVLFERAVSQAAWTFGSVPSFISSRYPQTLEQVRVGGRPLVLPTTGAVSLPAVLRDAGYRTALVSDHLGMRRIVALTDIDEVEWIRQGRSAEHVAVAARDRLRRLAEDGRPFFLWAYFNQLHYPYRPPPPFTTRFQDDGVNATGKSLPFSEQRFGVREAIPRGARIDEHHDVDHYVAAYDGCIAASDHAVATLVAELERLGLADDTIIVLNADHGELLGEEGYYFSHGSIIHRASIHVPLLFVVPGHEAVRVPGIVELLDLAPTVLDLVGVDDAAMAPVGSSLVPCFDEPERCSGRLGYARSGRARHDAVVQGNWLLRCGSAPPCTLFDFASGDVRDNAGEAARLERALADWRERFPPVPPREELGVIDHETERTLRELGYID